MAEKTPSELRASHKQEKMCCCEGPVRIEGKALTGQGVQMHGRLPQAELSPGTYLER